MMPKLQISDEIFGGEPWIFSGEAKWSEPIVDSGEELFWSSALPKSQIFGSRFSERRILEGLRSQWMMLCSWAWCKARVIL